MTARALLTGQLDALEFLVAQDTGMSLTAVRDLPNVELEEWRGFYMAKGQQQELASLKAGARRG